VAAHVLPARGTSAKDDSMFAYRDFAGIEDRIQRTYEASRDYLEQL
jgi:NTE family protein